ADPLAGSGAGTSWIVFGGTGDVNLDALTGTQGIRLDGQTAGERFGRTIASVGDVDGNGTEDIAFGSDFAVRHGRPNAGEVTLAHPPGPASPPDPDVVPIAAPVAPATPAAVRRNPVFPRLTSRPLRADRHGHVALAVECTHVTSRCRGTLTLRYAGRTLSTR